MGLFYLQRLTPGQALTLIKEADGQYRYARRGLPSRVIELEPEAAQMVELHCGRCPFHTISVNQCFAVPRVRH